MTRRFALIIVALLALGALLATARPAAAVECAHGPLGAYVCDARPRQQTFTAPGFQPGSVTAARTYAWLDDHAPLYAAPGGPVADEGTMGILYYTVEETVTDAAGQRWYRVDDRWASANDMHVVGASTFSGVELLAEPQRPFGWLLQRVRPSPAPGAEPAAGVLPVSRYSLIQVYDAAEGPDGWVWYNIGLGRWIKQTYLGLVDVSPRPTDVGPDEYWVEVDLYEQTFAAYEGDRMVYAGLVASGLERWPTNEGLFTVYSRHREWPMWGGEVGDDFYYLQDVPYTMFFDGEIALHGAYWHDVFGYPRSHGCVNMSPRDAEWVWHWSAEVDYPLWVHVYSSTPETLLEYYNQGTAGANTPGNGFLFGAY